MSFLQNFEALRKSIPLPATRSNENEDSEYMDYGGGNKNCYFCFIGIQLENSLYCDVSGLSHSLVDCEFCTFSQLCYECVECTNCFQSTYLFDCTKCQDCHYCSMCINCTNCFGCVALTHKKYCIFNKQFTTLEYEKEIIKLKKVAAQEHLTRLNKLIQQTPYPQSHQRSNVNCPYGDYISYSKNSYWCFETYYLEDSGYAYNSGLVKNSWDTYFLGGAGSKNIMEGVCELCYECVGGGSLYHCAYLYQSSNCRDCYYGRDLRNCSDCFGCVGLTHKRYCILNNQLTKSQYEKAVIQMKQELGWKV